MEIAADSVVLIHYTLKDDDGKVLDSSAGGEPLAYIQGHGNLVSGLEKALEGKTQGNRIAVTLAPGRRLRHAQRDAGAARAQALPARRGRDSQGHAVSGADRRGHARYSR